MRTGPRHSPPAYRFAVTVLRPLLMSLTRRAWTGAEHLPRDRGFVAVSNHISHVDPFVFAHFLNDSGIVPHFLGKVEVFRIPLIGMVLRGADQIPVYRETGQASDAYRAAVQAVEDGKCVAIYPEGTVTREPDLWPMRGKTGAARIALETGCPVIPVAQWGAQEILGPYSHRPSVLPRHTMQVSAGEPVDLDDLHGRPVTAEVLAEATERIMVALTAQLEPLRGETAPEGRFDPREHGITVTGRPRAVRPSERSAAAKASDPAQWAEGAADARRGSDVADGGQHDNGGTPGTTPDDERDPA